MGSPQEEKAKNNLSNLLQQPSFPAGSISLMLQAAAQVKLSHRGISMASAAQLSMPTVGVAAA
jgi:hypothetical protein